MSKKPAPARRGRPPKGATVLSRTAIVDATVQVIDVDGVGAVGMRSVARVLGVDAKSLYNHVADKNGLLDAVAETLLGSIAPVEITGDTRADLHAVATAFRRRALLHPQAAALVLTRQLPSFEALAPIQAMLEILTHAGFGPDEAVPLLRALLATLIGTLLREVQAGPTYGSADPEVIARRQSDLEQCGLPAVVEAAPYLARFNGAQEFEYAIGLGIDAVLARAERATGR